MSCFNYSSYHDVSYFELGVYTWLYFLLGSKCILDYLFFLVFKHKYYFFTIHQNNYNSKKLKNITEKSSSYNEKYAMKKKKVE